MIMTYFPITDRSPVAPNDKPEVPHADAVSKSNDSNGILVSVKDKINTEPKHNRPENIVTDNAFLKSSSKNSRPKI